MFNPILIPSLFSLLLILVVLGEVREDIKAGVVGPGYGTIALGMLIRPGLLIAVVWALYYLSFYALPR